MGGKTIAGVRLPYSNTAMSTDSAGVVVWGGAGASFNTTTYRLRRESYSKRVRSFLRGELALCVQLSYGALY